MLLVALLLPTGTVVIPGQTLYVPEQPHTEQVEQADTTEAGESNDRLEEKQAEFYAAKSMYRNALGVSNYIAAFLVFVGSVCLFSGARYLAGLFGLIAVITLSRFAMVFIVIVTMAWMIKRRFGAAAALGFIALASACGILLVASIHDLAQAPSSLDVRFDYWQSGWEAIRSDPLIGQPRSYILCLQDTSILWNPHNLLLSYGAYFGIIGLLIYLAYLCVAFAALWRRAQQSDVWMGILFGLAILLGWANFEVLAFTPAFEILLASLYVLASNDERSDTRSELHVLRDGLATHVR
jgi:O-antigen ligase